FFFQAEDGIRDGHVTGVQTCALPISWLFLAVGLAVGTALGAGILRARSSSRLAVSEAAAGELRRQLEQIGAESSDLKVKLEEEQIGRASVRESVEIVVVVVAVKRNKR